MWRRLVINRSVGAQMVGEVHSARSPWINVKDSRVTTEEFVNPGRVGFDATVRKVFLDQIVASM